MVKLNSRQFHTITPNSKLMLLLTLSPKPHFIVLVLVPPNMQKSSNNTM